MAARTAAVRYYRDLARLGDQTSGLIRRLWRRVDRGDITDSWRRALPDATAVLIAGQIVAAELADPYLTDVLGDDGPPARRVQPEAFAGSTPAGKQLDDLLYLPVIGTKERIAAGASARGALRQEERTLDAYVLSTVSDAGRLAVAAGMGTRPHAAGYYRMLQPPSCDRCAILAGRFYRYNQGFKRHPGGCDCVHIPVQEADDSLVFDARKAIAAGQVTGLSKADTAAIVDFGADPAQVINAKRGVYAIGAERFTTTGTTRRGVAGARILERDLQRSLGGADGVRGRTFRNMTFSRQRALEATELLRQGKTYTRRTKSGRLQSYAYQFTRSARPTPEQILADAGSREEAVRLLTNYGYIL